MKYTTTFDEYDNRLYVWTADGEAAELIGTIRTQWDETRGTTTNRAHRQSDNAVRKLPDARKALRWVLGDLV